MTWDAAWKDALITYLSNPFQNQSIGDFCKEVGISSSTYYRFLVKYEDKIGPLVDKERQKFKSQIRSEAYKCLVKRLSRSDNALKLTFQLLGDLIERSESKTEIIDPEIKKLRIKQLLDTIGNQSQDGSKLSANGPRSDDKPQNVAEPTNDQSSP